MEALQRHPKQGTAATTAARKAAADAAHSPQQHNDDAWQGDIEAPREQQQQQQPSHSQDSEQQVGGDSGELPPMLPSSNLGDTSEQYQLLRMECISQAETRRLLAMLDIAFDVSMVAFLAYIVLRFQPLSASSSASGGSIWFFCSTHFSTVNLAVAAVLLPCTTATAFWSVYRYIDSLTSHKIWSHRRFRLLVMNGTQLAAASVGMACYLTSNALVVSKLSCASQDTRRAIYWLAFVRWSCWNTTFLTITMRAHSTMIVPQAAATATQWQLLLLGLGFTSELDKQDQLHQLREREKQQEQAGSNIAQTDGAAAGSSSTQQQQPLRPSMAAAVRQMTLRPVIRRGGKPPPDLLVLDLPWRVHWPKAIVWCVFEACALALVLVESNNKEGSCTPLSASCALVACYPRGAVVGLLSGELVMALMYYAAWVWLMARSGRLLRLRPWQKCRTANTIFRLERRTGIWAYSIIMLASVVFWFASLSDCSRAAFQYHGLPTTEIMWCFVSVIGAAMAQPHNPHQANPKLVTALQQFSWTESGLDAAIKARSNACRGRLAKEPMFCFESAIKLFFWSCLMYEDYEGARAAPAGSAASVPAATLEQLMKGLSLYNLTVHKVVYDASGELKVVVAWSTDTVLVSFRGSTTAANWVADAMLWRSAHPGSNVKNKRAALFGAPKIHSGFLRCWSGTGLDQKVLGMLGNLIDTALDQKRLKIYLTGHSLGGAIATLAAYDLLVQYKGRLDPLKQVSVYTFGAPRVGNHAFARIYEEVVPDTWHVINDQDTVPRGGKFVSAYKRNGQRVVVNKAGDMVVRPVPLESSLLQMPLGSNPLHHLLASYQAAMTAVALGQLDGLKGLPGGAEGLINLVKECPIMAESMYRYGDRRNLITWLGGRVMYTLRSRAPRETLQLRRLVAANAAMVAGADEQEGSGSSGPGQRATVQRWLKRRRARAAQLAAARQAARRRQQRQQLQLQQRDGAAGSAQGDIEMGMAGADEREGQNVPGVVGARLVNAFSGGLARAGTGIGGLWRTLTLQGSLPLQHPLEQAGVPEHQQQLVVGLPAVPSLDAIASSRAGSGGESYQSMPSAAEFAAGSSSGDAAGSLSAVILETMSSQTVKAAAAGADAARSAASRIQQQQGSAAAGGSSTSGKSPLTMMMPSPAGPMDVAASEQIREAQEQAAADRLDNLPGPLSELVGLATGVQHAGCLGSQRAPAAPLPPAAAAGLKGSATGRNPGLASGSSTGRAAPADGSGSRPPGDSRRAALVTQSMAGKGAPAPGGSAPGSSAGVADAAGLISASSSSSTSSLRTSAPSVGASSWTSPFSNTTSHAASDNAALSTADDCNTAALAPAAAGSAAAAVAPTAVSVLEAAAAASLDSTASLALALDRLQFECPVLEKGPSLLLQPAHTAPQALLNPAAVLAGVRQPETEDEERASGEGILAGILGESAGESLTAAAEKAKTKWRGVMGMAGAKKPGHSNAGTLADAGSAQHHGSGPTSGQLQQQQQQQQQQQDRPPSRSGDSSSSSGSGSSSIHRLMHAVRHPMHPRSGGKRSRSRAASGSSTSGSAAAGSGGDDDSAVSQRHLVSLDVRRLSLPDALAAAVVSEAAMQTQVHLPVLPEGE